MTGAGNNTYLLVDDGEAVLVDAGVGEAGHLADLAAALDENAAHVTDVLVTHGHADHASGAPAIAAAYPAAAFRKYRWPGQDERYDVPWQWLCDDDVATVGGERVRVLFTPGHSPDHVAFWHEASGT